MTLLERFRQRYSRGCLAFTSTLAAQPTLKQDAVLTAVNLSPHPEGFFSYRDDAYFWTIGETLDGKPCLIVGPIEDY